MADVKGIARVCEANNVPLLVDNAHGSHLICVKGGLHPIKQGASMVCDSLHKTLPVLTGGALLHVMDKKLISGVKESMAVFGSTSPSFLVMSTMDSCCMWLKKYGRSAFENLIEKVKKIKIAAHSKGLMVLDKHCDPARISLCTAKIGYSGYEFMKYLHKNGIEPEFCDENFTVLIPTPFNTDEELEKLHKVILNIKVRLFRDKIDVLGIKAPHKTIISLREAMFSESKKTDVKKSDGKIVARIIAPCPPGIPLLIPGEVIGEYQRQLLMSHGIFEVDVVK
jgi:arginine/lysine/ornithine decarboxylase